MKQLFLSIVILGFAASANATLIGDTVTYYHTFPTETSIYSTPQSATVVAGTGDLFCSYCAYYTVNVEADSIIIDILRGDVWNTGVEFNGFTVTGLNDSSGEALTGVSVDQTVSNWADSRLSFNGDSIWVNLIEPYTSGSYLGTGQIVLGLSFGQTSQTVPEPSSLLLLGVGLLGAGVIRKRRVA